MRVVIGVDGGGSRTRALVADVHGRALGYAECCGANPSHQAEAEENVREAIRLALDNAGYRPEDGIALVAGLAGIDRPEDSEWAARATDLPGLSCAREHVNDAVVAHAGALRSRPGIIAIAGFGGTIVGFTETGRQLCNGDFHHYAPAAARFLSYQCVHRVLAGEATSRDAQLVENILRFWGMPSAEALGELGAVGFMTDWRERNRRFGEMAPLVTAAAQDGSPLAQSVCDRAAEELVRGIRLVGGAFRLERIPVVLIGGAACSLYVRTAVERALAGDGRRFELVQPALPPVAGAVLMALRLAGLPHENVSPSPALWNRTADNEPRGAAAIES